MKGADQRGPTFWAAAVSASKGLLARRLGVRRRTKRGVGGVQKQWDKIFKGANDFGSHYLTVKLVELTGNQSDEDLIRAAMARFRGTNVYEARCKDRAADVTKRKTAQRKANQVHCPWIRRWRVLWHVEKFSGATVAASEGRDAVTGSAAALPTAVARRATLTTMERTWGPGATSRARAAQRRPKVTADICASRMLKASTDALSALGQATSERATVAFLNRAEMRDTPEAIALRHAHARKLMAASALNVSPPVSLSSLAGTAVASAPATGANVPAEGDRTLTAPALTSESTPRSPPAQAPDAEAALVPASTPAASGAGPDEPEGARMTTAASTSAPPASAAGTGAASRGRPSLVTKHSHAAAALSVASKTLDEENHGIISCLFLPCATLA